MFRWLAAISLVVFSSFAFAVAPDGLRVIPGISWPIALETERGDLIEATQKLHGLDAIEATLVYFVESADLYKTTPPGSQASSRIDMLIQEWTQILALPVPRNSPAVITLSEQHDLDLRSAQLVMLARSSMSRPDQDEKIKVMLTAYKTELIRLIDESHFAAR
jgi:hypothetical protein